MHGDMVQFLRYFSAKYPAFDNILRVYIAEFGASEPPMILVAGEFGEWAIKNLNSNDLKILFHEMGRHLNSEQDYVKEVIYTGFVEGVVNFANRQNLDKISLFDNMPYELRMHAEAWDSFH